MAGASVIRGAFIIGRPGGWSVTLRPGRVEKHLGTRCTDNPRTWRSLDAGMAYLHDKRQIVRVDLPDATQDSEGDMSRRPRQDVAQRMKGAHEAAAYDTWFRTQVQATINDPRPSVPDDAARTHFAPRKTALRQRGPRRGLSSGRRRRHHG